MTKLSRKSTTLAMVAIIGLTAVATESKAQRFNGLGNIKTGSHNQTPAINDLGRNVYEIDNLADQMVFRYGWELRFNRGCKDSISLYNQIQKHTDLTNDLVRAYRGKCGKTFQKAARDVNESLSSIQEIRKKARVTDGVSRLINEASPKAVFVHTNSIYFQPKTQSPTYSNRSNRYGGFKTAQVSRRR